MAQYIVDANGTVTTVPDNYSIPLLMKAGWKLASDKQIAAHLNPPVPDAVAYPTEAVLVEHPEAPVPTHSPEPVADPEDVHQPVLGEAPADVQHEQEPEVQTEPPAAEVPS